MQLSDLINYDGVVADKVESCRDRQYLLLLKEFLDETTCWICFRNFARCFLYGRAADRADRVCQQQVLRQMHKNGKPGGIQVQTRLHQGMLQEGLGALQARLQQAMWQEGLGQVQARLHQAMLQEGVVVSLSTLDGIGGVNLFRTWFAPPSFLAKTGTIGRLCHAPQRPMAAPFGARQIEFPRYFTHA